MAMTRSEDEEFTTFLRDKAMEAQKALNYRPSYFLQMLGSLGGYQAVIALISQPNPSEGFAKLWEGGRLDLSVEALVVQGRWRGHFNEQLLKAAERRLTEVGYELHLGGQGRGLQSIKRVPQEPEMHIDIARAAGSNISASSQAHSPVLPFVLAKQYSRSDVFKVLNLNPEPTGGPWFTGYAEHDGNCFIFCNVGAPGRTGHDYSNQFDGDRLVWFGKGPSKLEHSSIQRLLKPERRLYIFYRLADRDSFTFAGVARPHHVFDTTPVKVVWDFYLPFPLDSIKQATSQIGSGTVIEGAAKKVMAKVYERDRGARLKCISHWGWKCFVCLFDFVDDYGELGEGFIHVHHLKPLAEIGEAYMLDPVADLRPVCPNCHAMLHRSVPALTIEALQAHRSRTRSLKYSSSQSLANSALSTAGESSTSTE